MKPLIPMDHGVWQSDYQDILIDYTCTNVNYFFTWLETNDVLDVSSLHDLQF